MNIKKLHSRVKRFLHNYWEVFFIFLISLTPFLWLKDGAMIIGHDSGFRLQYLQYWKNLFYSWNPIVNFGTDWSIYKGFLITQLPETLFSFLTKSLSSGEKITFIFWFFIMGLSFYICVKSFFPKKQYWILRVSGSTLYMYNFFLLQAWFIVERAKFSLFAALPLGFLIIYKCLIKEYPLFKSILYFSLVSFFLNGGGNPTLFGGLLLIYILTFFYLTVINSIQYGIKEVIFSIKVALFFALGFILVNAYWIFPVIFLTKATFTSSLQGFGGVDGILGWEAIISKNASFLNLFRLEGVPDWYDNVNHPYSSFYLHNPILIIASFLFIVVILLGLVFKKKLRNEYEEDKLFFCLFFLCIVTIIFAAGSHPPLGFLYILFIKYIPGFTIFRSSFYKFASAFWFSMIFLFSYFLNRLLLISCKNKIIYFLSGAIVILFILVYHFPFFTVNFFLWNKPFTTKVKIPIYVRQMSDYVNTYTDSSSKILILPLVNGNGADSYSWGYLSSDPAPELSINRSVIGIGGDSFFASQQLYKAIGIKDQDTFLYLCGIFGINKILWRDDFINLDELKMSSSYQFIKNNMISFKGVSLEKKIGEWILYDVNSPYYQSNFYTTTNTVQIAKADLNTVSLFKKSTIITPSTQTSVVTDNSISNKVSVIAECIFCKDLLRDNSQSLSNAIVSVQFLPDSVLYPLVLFKEYRLVNSLKDPGVKADIFMSLSDKRIGELHGLINKHEDTTKNYVITAIKKYEDVVALAFAQIEKVPQEEKNDYYAKLYNTLNQQEQFMANIFSFNLLYSNQDTQLVNFIDTQLGILKKNAWITTKSNDLKYQFSVDVQGIYSIDISQNRVEPEKIVLDNTVITELQNVSLQKGIHRLELQYPQEENLIANYDPNQLISLQLKQGQYLDFPIRSFDNTSTYNIQFEYEQLEGKSPYFSVFPYDKNTNIRGSDEIGKTLYVNFNGVFDTFSQTFTPSPVFNNATMRFSLSGTTSDYTHSLIKNISIKKVFFPDIYVSKQVSVQHLENPQVAVNQINPTLYHVHVENAKNNYMLVFNENYNQNWRASIDHAGKGFLQTVLSEDTHFLVNAYTNGWLIDKKGTYDITIEYWPQKISYIGIAMSGLTIVTIVGIYFYISTKKRFKNE